MKMKKRFISRRVLHTELAVAAQYLYEHNYGMAEQMINQILNRVTEYDLDQKKEGDK